MEQLVARQAHNLEVARSNPASATTGTQAYAWVLFVWCILLLPFITLRYIQKRSANQNGPRFFFLFHLGEYFLVVLVCCLDTVLDTSVPRTYRLLDAVLGVVVLLN